MIKNLVITPPVVGRISIGRVVEKNGKRLPEKDDQFTITTQVQTKEGWMLHPYDEQYRKEAPGGKLRGLPVRMPFNHPELNLRADYTLFDRNNGRQMCVGDGESCQRVVDGEQRSGVCPGPEYCELGKEGRCKPYGRLVVQIGVGDDLGVFMFRTTGYNSIRTLAARLGYYQAVSGGLLSCMPLELKLRGKSTSQSHRAPVYYVDLAIREGLTLAEAVTHARELAGLRQKAGIDQSALDAAARLGYGAGFAGTGEEDGLAVVEEFYPEE